MEALGRDDRIEVAGARLEVRRLGARSPAAPPVVMLHEGLGSVAAWKDFPERVAARTGGEVVVYSRRGYGRSDPLSAPFAPDFMHREAIDVLPALLAALGIDRPPVLLGHSDGASIALIHAAQTDARVHAVIALAPHVFVEDETVRSAAAAREAFETGDLRARLARYHAGVDHAFRAWNDIWLDPVFRSWDITGLLPAIRGPVTAIQGEDDAYGTLAQIDAIERGVAGPFTRVVLPDCGHAPWRDHPERVLAAL